MSSKADRLGGGRSFGTAATAISSRRNAIETSLNGAGAAHTALTDLPVTLISDNPDNPRNHLRNLDELVDSVREVGVVVPVVVATADAYLRDRPDRADDLDDGAQYVVVDGHRRLEAARRSGLATIPIRVDNGRVSTDEALLEAAFVANYHRDDMTDIEEAHALKSLVDYYGSQSKASKRLGIPQGTISTKLSLLKLAPDLQADLVTGKRTVEHVRNLGKLDPKEQRAKADERAQAASARNARRITPPEPAPQPAPANPAVNPAVKSQGNDSRTSQPTDYHAVIIPTDEPAAPETTAPDAAEGSGREVLPEQRTAQPIEHGPLPDGRRLPYDEPVHVAWHMFHKMDGHDFLTALTVMVQIARDKYPDLISRRRELQNPE